MDSLKLVQEIALKVKKHSGRVFFVGGYVRDELLGIENKDIDIEVHGLKAEELLEILRSFGEVFTVGSSFGVYSLAHHHIDIALPRREENTGRGHRDFAVYTDPFIGTFMAAKRRDFTVNALMKDVLSGEIIDHFGGLEDLRNGVLRHVDDSSFVEDPLRVFRCFQFASRFGFKVNESTLKLCGKIDVSALAKERVEEELKKALVKGKQPSLFFKYLHSCGQLNLWFKEIEVLIDLKQDAIYHPEGDVFTHTMLALDEGVKYRGLVSDPYGFMLTILFHDLGKIVCSFEKDGRIHAYGHETQGLPLVKEALMRLSNNRRLRAYVLNMVELHMLPNKLYSCTKKKSSYNRMFDKALVPEDLLYFALCDKADSGDGRKEFLFERLADFRELLKGREVSGQDLMAEGLVPGAGFGEVLALGHKLFIAGNSYESCLKECLKKAKELGVKKEP